MLQLGLASRGCFMIGAGPQPSKHSGGMDLFLLVPQVCFAIHGRHLDLARTHRGIISVLGVTLLAFRAPWRLPQQDGPSETITRSVALPQPRKSTHALKVSFVSLEHCRAWIRADNEGYACESPNINPHQRFAAENMDAQAAVCDEINAKKSNAA